jgi:hypothetical protein
MDIEEIQLDNLAQNSITIKCIAKKNSGKIWLRTILTLNGYCKEIVG